MSAETTAAAVPGSDATQLRIAKVALLVVVVSTFMVSLDSTTVNVALPHIRDDFAAGNNVQWVVSGYLLGVASAYPASGWLADRFGPRKAISWLCLAFAGASLLSALAWSLPVLVAARIAQGFTGGPISPIGLALLLRVVPAERRGRALGTWGVVSMMAPALGPTVGGRLVDSISWHWMFVANIPMAVVAVYLALKHLDRNPIRASVPLDVRGMALGSTGLSCLLVTLSQGGRWGWSSPRVLALLAVGVVAMLVFVLHSLRAEHPALDPRLLRIPGFFSACAIVSLVSSAMVARVVFVPLQLADIRGYSAMRIGMMLAPAALTSAVGMLAGGRLADRVGPRLPVLAGTALTVVFTLSMATWEVSSPDWVRVACMAGQGLGFSLVAASSTALAMSRIPRLHLSSGSTWRMLWQQLGGAVAVAGLAGLLDARTPVGASVGQIQRAHDTLFLVITGYLLIALVLAWRVPKGLLQHEAN